MLGGPCRFFFRLLFGLLGSLLFLGFLLKSLLGVQLGLL